MGMLLGESCLAAKIYDTFEYYKMLEVATDASQEEIKSSYRRLALKWHPDKNENSKESTDKFAQLNSAYAVLSDPALRASYDTTEPEEPSTKTHDQSQGSSSMNSGAESSKNNHSRTVFTAWIARFKQSLAEKNKTKIVVCTIVVSCLTFIGFLKILQLCIKEDKTFSLGSFEIHVPPRGNASLGKQGFCSFSCSIPL